MEQFYYININFFVVIWCHLASERANRGSIHAASSFFFLIDCHCFRCLCFIILCLWVIGSLEHIKKYFKLFLRFKLQVMQFYFWSLSNYVSKDGIFFRATFLNLFESLQHKMKYFKLFLHFIIQGMQFYFSNCDLKRQGIFSEPHFCTSGWWKTRPSTSRSSARRGRRQPWNGNWRTFVWGQSTASSLQASSPWMTRQLWQPKRLGGWKYALWIHLQGRISLLLTGNNAWSGSKNSIVKDDY